MDRIEAIDILVGVIATNSEEENEAIDLAIEALQEPIEEVDYCNNCPYISWDKDCISRQQAINALCKECMHGGYDMCSVDCTEVAVLHNLPPVTPINNIQKVDTLIIAAALQNFAQDSERNISDRERAGELREQVLACGASMCNPVTPTEQNEEDILKFYYVESLDEYWIGQRCGTRYYGKWTGNCFTYGYSRYLPWGEHVVAPDTLWKEHTYPSEPKEIPFNEWLQGFLEKECQTERTAEWTNTGVLTVHCSNCRSEFHELEAMNFCPNCGAKMKGGTENE